MFLTEYFRWAIERLVVVIIPFLLAVVAKIVSQSKWWGFLSIFDLASCLPVILGLTMNYTSKYNRILISFSPLLWLQLGVPYHNILQKRLLLHLIALNLLPLQVTLIKPPSSLALSNRRLPLLAANIMVLVKSGRTAAQRKARSRLVSENRRNRATLGWCWAQVRGRISFQTRIRLGNVYCLLSFIFVYDRYIF